MGKDEKVLKTKKVVVANKRINDVKKPDEILNEMRSEGMNKKKDIRPDILIYFVAFIILCGCGFLIFSLVRKNGGHLFDTKTTTTTTKYTVSTSSTSSKMNTSLRTSTTTKKVHYKDR